MILAEGFQYRQGLLTGDLNEADISHKYHQERLVKFSLRNTAVDPGVGRNCRSRPFSGILASNFRTENQEWNFPLKFPS